MRIPKARILKYAAMGIIAAFIATFFLKKEKQQGHPRDYAEIAAEKIILSLIHISEPTRPY